MPAPPRKPMNLFNLKWDRLSKSFFNRLKNRLDDGMNYEKAINLTFKELNIQGNFKKFVEDTVYASFISGIGVDVDINKNQVRKALLSSTWPGEKLTLSSRINKTKLLPIIKEEIKTQLARENSIRRITKRLFETKLTTADFPKYMRELELQARRVLAGEITKEAVEFRSALEKAKKQVSELKGKLGTEGSARLEKSYQSILRNIGDDTEKISKIGLDKAIMRGIDSKARYNSERIARTESAKSYGQGFFEKYQQDKDIVGYKSKLSYKHELYDICDFYAEANLYGMGPGVYPITEGPPYPYHPNCLCVLDPVYRGTVGEFDEGAKNQELEELSNRERKIVERQYKGMENHEPLEK